MSPSSYPPRSTKPGPTVSMLCVDDEPSMLVVLRRLLRAVPVEVFTAASGKDALEVLEQRRIDILVTDIEMPGMDGLALVSRVRREYPRILRVVMTGGGTLERATDAINEGEVIRFFSKPFETEKFRSAILDLVKRVEEMREDSGLVARRARLRELYRWVTEKYPDALEIERTSDGEVVVGYPSLPNDPIGTDIVCQLLKLRDSITTEV